MVRGDEGEGGPILLFIPTYLSAGRHTLPPAFAEAASRRQASRGMD